MSVCVGWTGSRVEDPRSGGAIQVVSSQSSAEPVSQLLLLDYWLTKNGLLTTWIRDPERGLSMRKPACPAPRLVH